MQKGAKGKGKQTSTGGKGAAGVNKGKGKSGGTGIGKKAPFPGASPPSGGGLPGIPNSSPSGGAPSSGPYSNNMNGIPGGMRMEGEHSFENPHHGVDQDVSFAMHGESPINPFGVDDDEFLA